MAFTKVAVMVKGLSKILGSCLTRLTEGICSCMRWLQSVFQLSYNVFVHLMLSPSVI